MQLKINRGFQKRVAGKFGRYQFEVGVLQDGPHKEARQGKRGLGGKDVISSYAGGLSERSPRKWANFRLLKSPRRIVQECVSTI